MQNRPLDNATWARSLVNELIHQGVRHFCIAPGSRSTPLVQAVADHPLAISHIHFDERGLGFLGLGIAESKQVPVAIIVTSGTAVGNLMPAVIEAKYSFAPLILLTSDRPPELREMGANQTIDQVKIFGSHVKWAFDLPCPGPDLTTAFVRRIAAYAIHRGKMGPVHINCMFREPLSIKGKGIGTTPISRYMPTQVELTEESVSEMIDLISGKKRGIIIAGRMPDFIHKEPITELSRRLGWPIFADVLSNMRNSPRSVPYFSHQEAMPDAILHVGDRLVQKDRLEAEVYIHVCGADHCTDAYGHVTHRININPGRFAEQLLKHLPSTPKMDTFPIWKQESESRHELIDKHFASESALSELSLFYNLGKICNESTAIFLGNSMPVRDANRLLFPTHCGPIFANRGASGIDGNIATAIGLCRGLKMPIVAVIGDLTALHDINSLAMLREDDPITFIVVNNRGGGIFSFLPVAANDDIFEKYFAAKHGYTMEKMAAAFNLDYKLFEEKDFGEISLLINEKRPTLVEVLSDRQTNVIAHQELEHAVFFERRKLSKSSPSLLTRLYGARQ